MAGTIFFFRGIKTTEQEATMKTVYILTGATGHLGSNVLQELEKRGEKIRVLVMEEEYQRLKPASENTSFYPGDMT